jgi:hypothetical protein
MLSIILSFQFDFALFEIHPPAGWQKRIRKMAESPGSSSTSQTPDKSARTRVRAQVMRNYHTQRVQQEKQPSRAPVRSDQKPIPSAECQIGKFRFDEEKTLTPWVPVKTEPKNRIRKGVKTAASGHNAHPQTSRKRSKKRQEPPDDISSSSR